LPWLTNLATWLTTWLLARAFNMPEPLVQATGIFVYLRVQAFEHGVGRSLCPKVLARRLMRRLFGHPTA
jgi:hypothetical protein